MAEFDNIQRIAPFLDKHLLLQVLDHVQNQKVSRLPSCPFSTHTLESAGCLANGDIFVSAIDHAMGSKKKITMHVFGNVFSAHCTAVRMCGGVISHHNTPGMQVYDEKEVLSAQLDILKKTKLVDVAIDKHKVLHKTENVPQDLQDSRQNVVQQLKLLKADCKKLLEVIEDPSLAKVLKLPRP
jgi:hypothetical protein